MRPAPADATVPWPSPAEGLDSPVGVNGRSRFGLPPAQTRARSPPSFSRFRRSVVAPGNARQRLPCVRTVIRRIGRRSQERGGLPLSIERHPFAKGWVRAIAWEGSEQRFLGTTPAGRLQVQHQRHALRASRAMRHASGANVFSVSSSRFSSRGDARRRCGAAEQRGYGDSFRLSIPRARVLPQLGRATWSASSSRPSRSIPQPRASPRSTRPLLRVPSGIYASPRIAPQLRLQTSVSSRTERFD